MKRKWQYLVLVGDNFDFFCPAEVTRCTDGGEIWHGGPCHISLHRCTGESQGLARFLGNLHEIFATLHWVTH